MTDHPQPQPHAGPTLLCAGTDPVVAARVAEIAASLLGHRPAVVVATWAPPPLGGVASLLDALYDEHEDLRDAARQAAVRTARAAARAFDALGIHVTRQVCPEEQAPWQEILDLADEFDAGVIVAGTSERPLAHTGILGCQARALAHRARRPLLLIPPGAVAAAETEPVLVAYDGSPSASRAVAVAAALLRPRPAIVASIWNDVSYVVGAGMVAVPAAVVRAGGERLDEAARLQAAGQASEASAMLTTAGWSSEPAAIKASRNVPAAIVEAADEHDAAVIVTGTRGRSRVVATLLGSNAEAVVRLAERPVLLVPPSE